MTSLDGPPARLPDRRCALRAGLLLGGATFAATRLVGGLLRRSGPAPPAVWVADLDRVVLLDKALVARGEVRLGGVTRLIGDGLGGALALARGRAVRVDAGGALRGLAPAEAGPGVDTALDAALDAAGRAVVLDGSGGLHREEPGGRLAPALHLPGARVLVAAGRHFLAGGADGRVDLFRLDPRPAVLRSWSAGGPVRALAARPDASWALVERGTRARVLALAGAAAGRLALELPGPPLALAACPGGGALVLLERPNRLVAIGPRGGVVGEVQDLGLRRAHALVAGSAGVHLASAGAVVRCEARFPGHLRPVGSQGGFARIAALAAVEA